MTRWRALALLVTAALGALTSSVVRSMGAGAKVADGPWLPHEQRVRLTEGWIVGERAYLYLDGADTPPRLWRLSDPGDPLPVEVEPRSMAGQSMLRLDSPSVSLWLFPGHGRALHLPAAGSVVAQVERLQPIDASSVFIDDEAPLWIALLLHGMPRHTNTAVAAVSGLPSDKIRPHREALVTWLLQAGPRDEAHDRAILARIRAGDTAREQARLALDLARAERGALAWTVVEGLGPDGVPLLRHLLGLGGDVGQRAFRRLFALRELPRGTHAAIRAGLRGMRGDPPTSGRLRVALLGLMDPLLRDAALDYLGSAGRSHPAALTELYDEVAEGSGPAMRGRAVLGLSAFARHAEDPAKALVPLLTRDPGLIYAVLARLRDRARPALEALAQRRETHPELQEARLRAMAAIDALAEPTLEVALKMRTHEFADRLLRSALKHLNDPRLKAWLKDELGEDR